KPKGQVVQLIRDQSTAIQSVFDYVKDQRPITNHYIKSLHQLLTTNQVETEAIDPTGKRFTVPLERGQWKTHPNNPQRPDGALHEYCPPEQVASQMDELLRLHQSHLGNEISPEIEAAWFHHRFTQIHPFQDGNGRVARLLASLIFIKAGWFPLVVTRDEKKQYIEALEKADRGNLNDLISFFAKAQRRAFVTSISLSENVMTEGASVQAALTSIVDRLKVDQKQRNAAARETMAKNATYLQGIADTRLKNLEQDITNALLELNGEYRVFTTRAVHESPNDHYFYVQIIEAAKSFDYFAKVTTEYKAWSRLSIIVENVQTDILLSFHAVGRDVGVAVCSPIAFRKQMDADASDSSTQPMYQDLEVLAEAPFQFTHLQQPTDLETPFRKWLENVLVLALAYWQRNL
ncbi:MAG: Fic family protein, partial [Chloroflexota bacterium]